MVPPEAEALVPRPGPDGTEEAEQSQQAGDANEAQRHGESGGCSSGESNTRAKRSATASATNYKPAAGSPPAEPRRPGSGGDGSGSGSGSRAGSGNEDGPTSAQPRSATAAKAEVGGAAAGKGGKRKLARPEGTAQCPRCESQDTKFCYYNNYNIKQPRYFCKACQRYWTAGGILRNVPVGAGRRKSKSSAVREQEKAATAAAAKASRQAGGGSGAAAAAAPPGTLAGGFDGGGPLPAAGNLVPGAGELLAGGMGGGYPDQLRFMMDPCGPLAPGMGGPMGYDGGFGAAAFGAAGMMLPPHAVGLGSMAGTPRLSDAPGATLTSGFSSGKGMSGGGDGFPGVGSGPAEDGPQANGRRVRARTDASGAADGGSDNGGEDRGGGGGSLCAKPGSALRVHTGGSGGGSGAGGDDRHPEWAAAAQAAERQQAASLAAQVAAAQAASMQSMQQAAAMQAQAQLQAAAAGWGQAPGAFGLAGASMWPPYPVMGGPSAYMGGPPNWAAAAQLGAARFGGNPFPGAASSEVSGAASGGIKLGGGTGGGNSGAEAGQDAGGDLGGVPMLGGGLPTVSGWHNMMPTGSAGMGMGPAWGMGGDISGWGGGGGGGNMPHMALPHASKHFGGSVSGCGGPAGSSLASGQSANTGLQAPGV